MIFLCNGCSWSSIGSGSEILVLDMGEPVRIVDLAEELIRLSGLTPYEDIDIVITGLRPGEKLFEELLLEGEGIMPTSHHKIKVLAPVEIALDPVIKKLEELYATARSNDLDALMEGMMHLVHEFRPTYSFQGEAPATFQRVRPDLFASSLMAKAKILPLPSRK